MRHLSSLWQLLLLPTSHLHRRYLLLLLLMLLAVVPAVHNSGAGTHLFCPEISTRASQRLYEAIFFLSSSDCFVFGRLELLLIASIHFFADV